MANPFAPKHAFYHIQFVSIRWLANNPESSQQYIIISNMQTICGLSGLNMSLLRFIRQRRYRTDRQRNNINSYLSQCSRDCDRASTRLIIHLLQEIVSTPDRQELLVALPVLVALARRVHNTPSDRRMLSSFFVLGQCLSPCMN